MIEVTSYSNGYDKSWNWGPKTKTYRLSNRCHARLIRDAREHFDGLGIDFTQYGEPVASLWDDIIASVEWTHRTSGKTLTLCEVWFDEKTGKILQCGQNYGGLVS